MAFITTDSFSEQHSFGSSIWTAIGYSQQSAEPISYGSAKLSAIFSADLGSNKTAIVGSYESTDIEPNIDSEQSTKRLPHFPAELGSNDATDGSSVLSAIELAERSAFFKSIFATILTSKLTAHE